VISAPGTGIDTFWTEIERYRKVMTESGELEAKRRRQAIHWMWTLIDSGLRNRFRHHPRVRHDLEAISRAVTGGSMTPAVAAYQLLGYLDRAKPED
jgi:GTPase